MATATLTKVGNSAAAFLPASIRKAASIEVGDSYKADSPRKGTEGNGDYLRPCSEKRDHSGYDAGRH